MEKSSLIKTLLLTLIVIVIRIDIRAQSIEWSAPYDEKFEFPYEYVGENKENYFFLSNVSERNYSDRNLVALSKQDLSLKYKYLIKKNNKSFTHYAGGLKISENIISIFFNKGKYFYRTNIDANTGEVLTKLEQVFEISTSIQRKSLSGWMSVLESGRIEWETGYVLGGEIINGVYVPKNEITSVLTDENYKILTHKTEKNIPLTFEDRIGNKFVVNNINNEQLDFIVWDTKKNYEKIEEKIDLSSLGFNSNDEAFEVTLLTNKNGEVVGHAMYEEMVEFTTKKGETSKESTPKGYLFFKVDTVTKQITNLKKIKFGENLYKVFHRISTGLGHIEWRQKILNTEGNGQIIIIEPRVETKAYEYSVTNTFDNKETYSGTQGSYEELLVYNLDENGDLMWENIIPKKQIFGGNSKAEFHEKSYSIRLIDNNIILLFNDDSTNKGKSPNEQVAFMGENSFINCYIIDVSSGTVKNIYLDSEERLFNKNIDFYKSFIGNYSSPSFIFGKNKHGKKIGKIITN